jgi:hypothetical protein
MVGRTVFAQRLVEHSADGIKRILRILVGASDKTCTKQESSAYLPFLHQKSSSYY